MSKALTSVGLAILVLLIGCSTTPVRTVDDQGPACTVPPKPAFDSPPWDDLLIPFSWIDSGHDDWRRYDEALDQLEEYEADLVDYARELQAVAKSACTGSA